LLHILSTGVLMNWKYWLIAVAAAGLMPAAAQSQPAGVPAGKQEQAASAATGPAAPAGGASEAASTGATAATANPSATPAATTDATPGASAVSGPVTAPGATTPAAPAFQHAAPEPGIGMPDGRMGLQDQFTPVGREAAAFHNNWLLVLCALISLFVLGLLLWTMVRYRRSANATPSRTSHNTFVEVVWTLVPVLILVAIAVPSIRLIRHQYSPPPADLTVKVIGNQWYWTYQYPDHGGFEIVSNMLKERNEVAAGARFRTDADGPRLLAVDQRLVIPAGKTVKFIVTSNDVIHSFAMPAFWVKTDANPGILNETWVKVDRPGVYFGQCSELCGARHAFMPIAIEVVTPDRFNQWIASKGGTLPGATPAAADSTAATVVSPAAGGAPTPVAGATTAAPPTAPQPAAPGNTQANVANRATDGTN
jgi:cytochrome c oxidase subunit 2